MGEVWSPPTATDYRHEKKYHWLRYSARPLTAADVLWLAVSQVVRTQGGTKVSYDTCSFSVMLSPPVVVGVLCLCWD